MVRARRALLDTGRYRSLVEGLEALADELRPAKVVDAGCGEGTLTAALVRTAQAAVAFDLSKPGVRLAARRLGSRAVCCVAGVDAMPVVTGSAQLVASVMAPVHEAELRRVLAPAGRVLVVSPGPDHLDGFRRLLYAEPRPHDGEVPLSDRWRVVEQRRFRSVESFDADEAMLVHAMTPYRWNAPAEGVERLRAAGAVEATVDFVATVLEP